jgi:hypothetical protein
MKRDGLRKVISREPACSETYTRYFSYHYIPSSLFRDVLSMMRLIDHVVPSICMLSFQTKILSSSSISPLLRRSSNLGTLYDQ